MKRVMFVAMVGLFAAGWMTTVQKLGENHPPAAAGSSQSQSGGRRRLTFSVAVIQMNHISAP